MSVPPSPHEHFAHMLGDFQKASESVYNALATIAESEMRALAKRFPKRRIAFHSGMGSTQITITRRIPWAGEDTFEYSGERAWTNWPEWLEEPAPDLWSAIRTYEYEVSDGKDPGLGTIIYENGKRIAGLVAGGAVK